MNNPKYWHLWKKLTVGQTLLISNILFHEDHKYAKKIKIVCSTKHTVNRMKRQITE